MSKKIKAQTKKNKTVPMRMCGACRARHPKSEMIRIVLSEQGSLAIDGEGKSGGRGVNLCARVECLEKAIEMRVFDKVWSGSQAKTNGKAIRSEMDEVMKQRAFRPGGANVTYRVAKVDAELHVGHPVTRAL